MTLGRGARVLLGTAVGFVLLVVYAPLGVVVISSFNADQTFGWPPDDLTLRQARLLASADRVFHAADVPRAILDRARADAARIGGEPTGEPGLSIRLDMA